MAQTIGTAAAKATIFAGKAQPPTLLTIAPELRNSIYELVFAADAGPVKLLEASPPEKALLQVCRKTQDEAAGLYVAAFRSYWRNTIFTIRRGPEIVTPPYRVNFGMQDVKQVRTLLSIADGNNLEGDFPILQGHVSRLFMVARADSVCTLRHFENACWRLVTVDENAVNTSDGVLIELNDEHGPSFYSFRSKALREFPVERQLTLRQLEVALGRKLVLKDEEATASGGRSEIVSSFAWVREMSRVA
ncbi:hypothetical protein LTS10_009020 [Elasticomyces elasticus]|nr:hypothetical protein LTS10_009020 [Elasticomyces elasticus]